MSYTYEPYLPEVYNGKVFMVTPDEGAPFTVAVANDESEVPALVDLHMNPPTPAPYPPPTPAPPPPEDVVLYDHENRLRALEGTPPLSLEDFRKTMKPQG